MQENHDRNKQLREENYELANKLKKFIEQYEAREKVSCELIKKRCLQGEFYENPWVSSPS